VRLVLEEAHRDQADADHYNDALSDETGGEFAFNPARAAACAAAAWLDLGRGKEAQESAQQALAELAALPTGRQPFSQLNGVRIDMASARLLNHDLDGAAEALQQVLDLPTSLRNMSLSGRLTRAGQALTSPPWANDAQAHQFAEAIRAWGR